MVGLRRARAALSATWRVISAAGRGRVVAAISGLNDAHWFSPIDQEASATLAGYRKAGRHYLLRIFGKLFEGLEREDDVLFCKTGAVLHAQFDLVRASGR